MCAGGTLAIKAARSKSLIFFAVKACVWAGVRERLFIFRVFIFPWFFGKLFAPGWIEKKKQKKKKNREYQSSNTGIFVNTLEGGRGEGGSTTSLWKYTSHLVFILRSLFPLSLSFYARACSRTRIISLGFSFYLFLLLLFSFFYSITGLRRAVIVDKRGSWEKEISGNRALICDWLYSLHARARARQKLFG